MHVLRGRLSRTGRAEPHRVRAIKAGPRNTRHGIVIDFRRRREAGVPPLEMRGDVLADFSNRLGQSADHWW